MSGPGLEHAFRWSVRFLAVAAAVLVAGFLLLELRLVVVPVLVALFLSTLLFPPAQRLRDRRIPRVVSTWTVLLTVGGALAVLGTLLAPAVANQLDEMGASLQQAVDEIEGWLTDGPLGLSRDQLDRYLDSALEEARSRSGDITSGIVSGALLAIEVLAGALLALVLTFFFVKDGDRMAAWVLGHVDEHRRPLARALGCRAWSTLGAYVRGSAIVGLADAAGIGIGLLVIGVPLVVPLMLLTFVGAFFPIVGATVAGVVAALVALVNGGLGDALLVGAVVLAVQQLESNFLQPVVMGRALRLHPVVILVSLTAGAIVAGLLGAFLAVPLTAVGVAVANEYRQHQAAAA
jgi:predicted PurR-regulated permease PerM